MEVSPEMTKNARLWQWAKDNGITTDEMAAKMGYNIVYLQQLLMGYYPIKDTFMGAFLRVYGPSAAAEAFGLQDTTINQPA